MGKIYFIDSENVGDSWISLLNTIADEDEILVFYTDNSPRVNYRNVIKLINSAKKAEFIECCEGNNALDFQLSTELGFRIHDMADSEFVIVSDDTGYDAVIKYWKKKNIPVKRIKKNECDPNKVSSELDLLDGSVLSSMTISSNPKTASCADDTKAKEILYIIGKDNLQMLHESLKLIYGDKKGKSYYNAFKTDSAYTNFIAKHDTLSLANKQELYCSIVFDKYQPKMNMPEDFPEFTASAWKKKKNLNSLKASLQGKYGKDMSDKYYSIIKSHVKILDKIK
ncbi:MAG: hypothetical protein K5894_11940 [Lachnospiraceae bacterium]|nr:hypothetical protein [Lachnospiraceae bacterium]